MKRKIWTQEEIERARSRELAAVKSKVFADFISKL